MNSHPAPPDSEPRAAAATFWTRRGEGVWITAVALVAIALDLTMKKQTGLSGLVFRVVTMLLVPHALLTRFASRPPREYGLDFRDWRAQSLWTGYAYALLLPVIFVFARQVEFQQTYLFTGSGAEFLYKELFDYGVRYVAWEYLLRAFLLFGLARQFGWWAVVLEEIIIFPLAHIGKPPLEIATSAYAGVVFSLAAYRSRSFLPAFVSHWALAVTLDTILFVHFRGWGPITGAFGGG